MPRLLLRQNRKPRAPSFHEVAPNWAPQASIRPSESALHSNNSHAEARAPTNGNQAPSHSCAYGPDCESAKARACDSVENPSLRLKETTWEEGHVPPLMKETKMEVEPTNNPPNQGTASSSTAAYEEQSRTDRPPHTGEGAKSNYEAHKEEERRTDDEAGWTAPAKPASTLVGKQGPQRTETPGPRSDTGPAAYPKRR